MFEEADIKRRKLMDLTIPNKKIAAPNQQLCEVSYILHVRCTIFAAVAVL